MAAGGWDQRFFSTTRGQVVAELWRTPRTVEELAAALGITDNAVRAHLSSLERDGLVRQSGVRRTQAKPAFVYDVTPAAERLFPKAYGPVLDHLLDVVEERLGAEELSDLLRTVGERLATESAPSARRPVPERIERALSTLRELGSTLEIDPEASRPGRVRLQAYSCPLAAATANHAEACQVIESFLARVIGARVSIRCEREGRPRCGFEVSVPRAA
ncbi:MAG TPA: helix-turn-helix domain-containing protein [Chloroflexota bacterium]|jgi:predicted ArsR family transcriptional regulator